MFNDVKYLKYIGEWMSKRWIEWFDRFIYGLKD